MTNSFLKSSKYYNIIYKKKNYLKEVNYINFFLKKNNMKILEVGCGTGNHAKYFLKKGHKVFGIDKSKSMINIANKNYKSINLKFKCRTIEKINEKNSFDACIALFHVVNYFASIRELKSFFKNSHRILKKNSFLMFDFWNGKGVEKIPPKKSIKKINKKNIKIVREGIPSLDKQKQIVKIRYKYKINLDRYNKTFYELHKIRYLFFDEIVKYSKKYFKVKYYRKWLSKTVEPSKTDWFSFIVLERKN